MSDRETGQARWMLLIHQIPPKPHYFRAKVGRRLQRIGAVAIKNSVYVLPRNDQTAEDFQWIAREIMQDGGDATVCTASFIEGLGDDQVEALFYGPREADYNSIAEDARALAADIPGRLARDDERRAQWEADVARLKKRLEEAIAIDFFGAPGREAAQSGLGNAETRLRRNERKAPEPQSFPARHDYKGRVWVTRKNIHVDRMGSAWLIRRFIDPTPTFKFVPGQGYKQKDDEVTFDMFEANFTHEGDLCTFEVLVERFDLREPGLKALAEIVHDIDVKDGKFGRSEASGVAAVIAGIALAHQDDDARLERAYQLYDELFGLLRRKRG
jgi:hypothetical protein